MIDTNKTNIGAIQLLNCAKGHATTIATIQSLAADPTCIIFLLQEPSCTDNGNPPEHRDFHLFTPTPTGAKCATYIRKQTGLAAYTTFTHSNSLLGTTVRLGSYQFSLYNFYFPKGTEPLTDTLRSFTPSHPCILMGDLNTHHPNWSAFDMEENRQWSRAGTTLTSWLEKHELTLHNTPGRPTFFPRRSDHTPSTIDLTLTSGSMTQKVITWTLNDDTTSDHSMYGLQLNLLGTSPDTNPETPEPFRNWLKTDWENFASIISKETPNTTEPMTKQDAIDAVTQITTSIHTATAESVPTQGHRKKKAPWWNHNLTILHRKVIHADRRARNSRLPEDLAISQKARAGWNKPVKHAKRTHWTQKMQDTDERSIWRVIKNHRAHQKPIPPIDNEDEFEGKCNKC